MKVNTVQSEGGLDRVWTDVIKASIRGLDALLLSHRVTTSSSSSSSTSGLTSHSSPIYPGAAFPVIPPSTTNFCPVICLAH